MPRRPTFSSPSKRSNSRNTATTTAPRYNQAPMQSQSKSQGGFMSNMVGTMFQGMAFGAGSEVAHNVIGSLMGRGNTNQATPVEAQNVQADNTGQCKSYNNNFVDCLKFNGDSISSCQNQLDSLNTCFQNQS